MSVSSLVESRAVIVGIFLKVCPGAVASSPPTSKSLFCIQRSSSATRLEEELRWIQNKLFDVGGLLATAPGQTFKNMPTITARDSTRLETLIDTCQKDLPALKEFILPGGGKISSFLQ